MWHKKGVKPLATGRRTPPPLNNERLQELALRYVGRFATTKGKLRAYLSRKVRERGWEGARQPDLEAIASRFAELGYIDDAAYAMSKARALAGRGYGKRRLADKLRVDGVDEEDGAAAIEHADSEAVIAALRFAQRRRMFDASRPYVEIEVRQDILSTANGRARISALLASVLQNCRL